MNTWSSIVGVLLVAALATLSAVPSTGYAASLETDLFSDNFDGYLLGSFPSDFVSNTWEIVWDGRGENYVVYGPSVSFPQSLQLWGRPSWSSIARRRFTTDAPVIGYEYWIQIDAVGTGGPDRVEWPGFFSREAATWGRGYATARFNHDTRQIEAEDGTVLGSWSPRTWYRVKVILDRRTNLYSVWIDGRLAGQNLQTRFEDTHQINAMAVMSGHPGVKVWYDDVRVFTVEEPDEPQVLAGTTDAEGKFEVALGPAVTVTGLLTECTQRPIRNEAFVIGLWPRGDTFTIEDLGGFTFSVPGYEDLTVTEFSLRITELDDEAVETADDPLQGEITGIAPFTGLNGHYAFTMDVGVLCLSHDDSAVRVRGRTDGYGEFSVALGPTTTISGFLADWTHRSLDLLSNQEFEISLHPRGAVFCLEDLGGFTFYVSGYEPMTVTEQDPMFYRSYVAGFVDYHVDCICLTRIDRSDD